MTMKSALYLFIILAICPTALAQTSTLTDRFTRLDRNRDGKLDAEEAQGFAVFQAADLDGDGFVTPGELRVHFMRRPGETPRTMSTPRTRPETPSAPEGPAATLEIVSTLDIRYASIEGVDPNLLSLDIHAPKGAKNAPVTVFVHGGSWVGGDKRSVGTLPAVCAGKGFVLVSMNYRLAPAVNFEGQAQDIAAAIAWTWKHAADYGGAADRLHLMGHSAGAHLATLVATDERYLRGAGVELSRLKGLVSLDGDYDLRILVDKDGHIPLPNQGTRGGLRTVRTMCLSPFPEDRDGVLYFGGFDSGLATSPEEFRYTAWIYKAFLGK